MSILGGWLYSASREARAVRRALAELSDQKTPVRVDVEGMGLRFLTIVTLHRTGLLLAKPRTLRSELPRYTTMRLTLPNRGRKQVRVPVLVPQVRLPLKIQPAFICALPKTFSGECQRAADRFDTTRYKSLVLHVPAAGKNFRVADLSNSGMRILTNGQGVMELFELGLELGPARLRIGHRVAVELSSLVPRSRNGKTVGLETQTREGSRSERYLTHLLRQLQQQELFRLRAETN